MTSRTASHSYSGSPPGPGSQEAYAATSSALVGVDVDHEPARDQIAGLRVWTVGRDRRSLRTAVSNPGAFRGQRFGLDVLSTRAQHLVDVPLKRQVRLHILRSPLVHRGHGAMRLRPTAVVLEEQVLRHGRLPRVVGRASCGAPFVG